MGGLRERMGAYLILTESQRWRHNLASKCQPALINSDARTAGMYLPCAILKMKQIQAHKKCVSAEVLALLSHKAITRLKYSAILGPKMETTIFLYNKVK